MQTADGYSVLITGGGSGLGAGIARYMAALGAKVTISGRRMEKLREVAKDIGPNCAICVGDVTLAEDREEMIKAANTHGNGLHGLVNGAGNMLRGPIEVLKADDILALMNLNVVAGMALTGLATPYLQDQGGAVLFIGSIHTRRAFPGAAPYAASKGAVETLGQVLAAELGPKGIRVNCLLPGAVPSEINIRAGLATDTRENLTRLQSMIPEHPLGRIGTPQDIAEAADYLMRAEWVTGTSLIVDGGLALGVTHK